MDVCYGFNGGAIAASTDVREASVDEIGLYKQRGKVENLFAILQRYPCLKDNKTKNIDSFRGLLLFVLSTILAKKINRILSESKDPRLAEIRHQLTLKKRDDNYRRKKERAIIRDEMKLKREAATEIRDAEAKIIKANIDEAICASVDWSKVNDVHGAYQQRIDDFRDRHRQAANRRGNRRRDPPVRLPRTVTLVTFRNKIRKKFCDHSKGRKEYIEKSAFLQIRK